MTLWHISGNQARILEAKGDQKACSYCAIETLAKQGLRDPLPKLLFERRNDDLVMIHININQPQMRSRPSQMKSLKDTLKAIGTGDVKMQVRVSIISAPAFKRDGNHRPYSSATVRSTQ